MRRSVCSKSRVSLLYCIVRVMKMASSEKVSKCRNPSGVVMLLLRKASFTFTNDMPLLAVFTSPLQRTCFLMTLLKC